MSFPRKVVRAGRGPSSPSTCPRFHSAERIISPRLVGNLLEKPCHVEILLAIDREMSHLTRSALVTDREPGGGQRHDLGGRSRRLAVDLDLGEVLHLESAVLAALPARVSARRLRLREHAGAVLQHHRVVAQTGFLQHPAGDAATRMWMAVEGKRVGHVRHLRLLGAVSVRRGC